MKTCTVRWGDNRCELPTGHTGPHKKTITDDTGRTRVRTWLNRWAA